jgi:hypothetical protein
MDDVKTQVRIFLKQFQEISELKNKKAKEQSECDLAISDLYHKIEGTVIKHVCESHAFIKELKILLTKRRQIKLDNIILQSVCDSLKTNIESLRVSLPKVIKKHDEVLTEILELGKK